MPENKNLVVSSQQHLTTQLEIANIQLLIGSELSQDIERRKFVEILKSIDKENAVIFLSKNSYLNEELIEKFKDKWDWYCLTQNEYLSWSIESIDRFKNKLNWEQLSCNKNLSWTLELIEKYEDKWSWGYIEDKGSSWNFYVEGLSDFEFLPWSIELIKHFEDKWDWTALSMNLFLPWSLALIERFEDKWCWKCNKKCIK